MTEKEYRSHPAISRSELWKMKESPEKFKYWKENPEEKESPALIFGRLFHAILLTPESLDSEFAIMPSVDRRTKEGKAEYAKFLEKSKGKTIVDVDMVGKAAAMAQAVQSNELCRKLLDGEKEIPLFWKDELTGEDCKCRLDVKKKMGEKVLIVDLKTTENAETESFMRSAIKYGYDFQAAMYNEAEKQNNGTEPIFVFIAVEKEPPYAVNILQADDLFVQRGYDQFRNLLGKYHYCKTNDNWYGYLGAENIINNLSLPAYLAKEME